MHDQTTKPLVCILNKGNISFFISLLQQGFHVAAKVGCDIQSLLCDQFKVVPEFQFDGIDSLLKGASILAAWNPAIAVHKDKACYLLKI